jgi:hypothetical protein
MIGRRQLFVLAGGALATACGKKLPSSCTDTTGLSGDEIAARTALGYADASGDPAKACSACRQYVEAKSDGACGECKVLKGPVHPNGTCKGFSAKG